MGFVTAKNAEFVHNGLRWGFEVGLHPDRLQGYRFFKNYESATGVFRSRVTEATMSRVAAGRTLLLGEAGCLLANIFALMIGLSVAWQKRRTTRAERQDYRFFYDILTLNLGRGYFRTDHFKKGPTVYSDASRWVVALTRLPFVCVV